MNTNNNSNQPNKKCSHIKTMQQCLFQLELPP